MAASASFLESCRVQIRVLPELTAFTAALASYNGAARGDRGRYWYLAFNDNQAGLSPAYRLRRAIRDIVTAYVDSTANAGDREAACVTLANEFCPDTPSPQSTGQEAAELQTAIIDDLLS